MLSLKHFFTFVYQIVMSRKTNHKDDLAVENLSPEDEALRLLFNDIFYSYEKPLFKLALNLCKDTDVAHDVVHDVFMKLWEIRQQLQEIKSIEAFLFTMTRNKVMDYLRKVASDTRLRQAIWDAMQDIVDNQEQSYEEKEYRAILRQAIEQLPAQRKAIYLLRDAGFNYQEIADEMQLSKHTVKNQVSAALKSLRQSLSKFLTF